MTKHLTNLGRFDRIFSQNRDCEFAPEVKRGGQFAQTTCPFSCGLGASKRSRFTHKRRAFSLQVKRQMKNRQDAAVRFRRSPDALTITIHGRRVAENFRRVELALKGSMTGREIAMLAAPEDLALLALDGGAAAFLCRVMGGAQ